MLTPRAEAHATSTAERRRLRILIALETSGGGSGRHALDLAEGLDRLGHGVVVLYSPVRAEAGFLARLEQLPVVKISVPMQRSVGLKDVAAFAAVRRAVEEYGPFDVLHAHSSKAGALIRALPTTGAKIYTPHAFKTMDPGASRLSGLLVGGVEAALGRLATDRIIAVSSAEAEHARTVLRVPAHKVTRIVNGVDTPALRPRAEVRAELGLAPEHVLVGFVGRFTWQKNPELYLRAMAQVCEAHPNARGLMMGDGELSPVLTALRAELGLEKSVSIISGQSALAYFSGMDCLVMTSRYEAMPYVMLEAATCGLPLLSTNVGGAAEAIKDGVTGLVLSSTPEAMANGISHLLSNPLLMHRFSRATVKNSTLYSIDRMVAETQAIYFDAIGATLASPSAHERANSNLVA